ncbi:hypothetical protein PR048_015092 [Dryococelus australis]|uniref:Uncharacterized protein n=1 Tax=Dryococelus australis TaxID=614101 RepID=A0ABQ9HG56_9NEOP|nr:hypothetical protein PR048_015092 [Dryococelus australis]
MYTSDGENGVTLAVHGKLSILEASLRRKPLPLHAYILMGALSDIRPVRKNKREKCSPETYNKKCLTHNTKIRHYKTVLKPVVLYTAETLFLNADKGLLGELEKKERKIIREIPGSNYKNGVHQKRSNKEVYSRTEKIAETIFKRRARIYGHLKRMEENRLTKKKKKDSDTWDKPRRSTQKKKRCGAHWIEERKQVHSQRMRDKREQKKAKSLPNSRGLNNRLYCGLGSAAVRHVPRSGEVWMLEREASMEQRPNEGAGEMGDPRKNPPTSGIIGHDSHLPKSDVSMTCVHGDAACQCHISIPSVTSLQLRILQWSAHPRTSYKLYTPTMYYLGSRLVLSKYNDSSPLNSTLLEISAYLRNFLRKCTVYIRKGNPHRIPFGFKLRGRTMPILHDTFFAIVTRKLSFLRHVSKQQIFLFVSKLIVSERLAVVFPREGKYKQGLPDNTDVLNASKIRDLSSLALGTSQKRSSMIISAFGSIGTIADVTVKSVSSGRRPNTDTPKTLPTSCGAVGLRRGRFWVRILGKARVCCENMSAVMKPESLDCKKKSTIGEIHEDWPHRFTTVNYTRSANKKPEMNNTEKTGRIHNVQNSSETRRPSILRTRSTAVNYGERHGWSAGREEKHAFQLFLAIKRIGIPTSFADIYDCCNTVPFYLVHGPPYDISRPRRHSTAWGSTIPLRVMVRWMKNAHLTQTMHALPKLSSETKINQLVNDCKSIKKQQLLLWQTWQTFVIAEGNASGYLAPTQLPRAVIGDPLCSLLFLERCARGWLSPSGNPVNADSGETCWRHRPPLPARVSDTFSDDARMFWWDWLTPQRSATHHATAGVFDGGRLTKASEVFVALMDERRFFGLRFYSGGPRYSRRRITVTKCTLKHTADMEQFAGKPVYVFTLYTTASCDSHKESIQGNSRPTLQCSFMTRLKYGRATTRYEEPKNSSHPTALKFSKTHLYTPRKRIPKKKYIWIQRRGGGGYIKHGIRLHMWKNIFERILSGVCCDQVASTSQVSRVTMSRISRTTSLQCIEWLSRRGREPPHNGVLIPCDEAGELAQTTGPPYCSRYALLTA